MLSSSEKESRDEYVISRYLEGAGCKEIADEIGVCRTTVLRIAQGYGLTAIRKEKENRERDTRDRKILALLGQGKTGTEISRLTGIAKTTVSEVIKKHTETRVDENPFGRSVREDVHITKKYLEKVKEEIEDSDKINLKDIDKSAYNLSIRNGDGGEAKILRTHDFTFLTSYGCFSYVEVALAIFKKDVANRLEDDAYEAHDANYDYEMDMIEDFTEIDPGDDLSEYFSEFFIPYEQ